MAKGSCQIPDLHLGGEYCCPEPGLPKLSPGEPGLKKTTNERTIILNLAVAFTYYFTLKHHIQTINSHDFDRWRRKHSLSIIYVCFSMFQSFCHSFIFQLIYCFDSAHDSQHNLFSSTAPKLCTTKRNLVKKELGINIIDKIPAKIIEKLSDLKLVVTLWQNQSASSLFFVSFLKILIHHQLIMFMCS